MGLLVGIDLDRVTNLHRKDPMGGDGVVGDFSGYRPRTGRGEGARDVPHCPTGDSAQDQQAYCCGDLRQRPLAPVTLFLADTRNAHAVRYRLGDLCCKCGAECLASLGIS
jgi:hypothetical protein